MNLLITESEWLFLSMTYALYNSEPLFVNSSKQQNIRQCIVNYLKLHQRLYALALLAIRPSIEGIFHVTGLLFFSESRPLYRKENSTAKQKTGLRAPGFFTSSGTLAVTLIRIASSISCYTWSSFQSSRKLYGESARKHFTFSFKFSTTPSSSLSAKVSEVDVVNEALRSHHFNNSAQFRPPLFAQSRIGSGLTIIHDVLFYYLVRTYTSLRFRGRSYRFPFLQHCLHIHKVLLLSPSLNLTQFGFVPTNRREQQRRISIRWGHAGCESGLIGTFPFPSSLVTSNCGSHDQTMFRALVTDIENVGNRRERLHLWIHDLSSAGYALCTLYSEQFTMTSPRFFDIKYDKHRVDSLTFGDQPTPVASTPPSPCRCGAS